MSSTLTAPQATLERESALPAVTVTGVVKAFGSGGSQVIALDGVDLEVAHGEFVCLLGASGCGKSTLLNLVAGLDHASSGEIRTNTSRPAVMFQESALLPWLTTAQNVDLPLRLAGVGRAERKRTVNELLDLVHLSNMHSKRPHELSGGMRQRVALARAIASSQGHSRDGRRGLLLMDEPFGALDAITRDVLQGELVRIWQATGTAILFVTHDVREAVRLSQRVVLLSSRPGRVVKEWHTVGDPRASEAAALAAEALSAEITVHLREVISSHAHA
jgi:NitT/TauT family transport system ATP-binding protein